ncbi:PqiA/YebS family transporter subunit [Enterovibrio paralichthyis]|uniref:PqiA/YebS family transporter subunit n=1 Tax=Enterovibrio paralichthyis TaxID=2853805 RepID=UPI001C491715|nr:paraquat-inducible protein A [Enterovibrio paralichthyis]MBV7296867.1 paraquat-inducible protein A [Enterovibrio paralichthyis]
MHVLRCASCDLLLHKVPVAKGFSARCPDCGSRVVKNSTLSLSGELAIAIAAFILFFPAQLLPLVTIDLFGVPLSTSVTSGAVILLDSFPFVGALVIFSTAIAPFAYLLSILLANLALHFHHARSLYYVTYAMKFLRHWVMIDVFLVSLAVAGFKVTEIAELSVGSGLFSFVVLQVLIAVLLSRVSPKKYWDAFSDSSEDVKLSSGAAEVDDAVISCKHCGLTQNSENHHCHRCGAKLEKRIYQSIQKTWASLIAATVFVFPANLYPISILLSNGKRFEDTIFSGVASLIKQGMYGIAIIIFTASIIVPVAKIVFLGYILICIQFKVDSGRAQRMKIYRFVQWIGKWSMMDLCVIAIMVSLIDRGNLLDFTPGPGAIAFGLVVVLTMIAAESLDSRLIWDKHEQR